MVYGLLFDMAAETLLTIAADPKHLGARIGATLVLHTWGSALTHHPHVHGIVPGGGLASDGEHWIACRRGFFLPVRVLSRLFRRRFLEALQQAHRDARLQFFGEHAPLANAAAFARWLAPLRQCEWVVYAKRPFAGPEAVLAYLSRYTHRVAISNERIVGIDGLRVRLRVRADNHGGKRTVLIDGQEFIARFLQHVLPSGFKRIRHYGLLASSRTKAETIERARKLIELATPAQPLRSAKPDPAPAEAEATDKPIHPCPCCGSAMIIIEMFEAGGVREGDPGQDAGEDEAEQGLQPDKATAKEAE